ncbi:hypothetical protein ACP70R_003882 [Stipagrostis hirtigluma subsp. patula]
MGARAVFFRVSYVSLLAFAAGAIVGPAAGMVAAHLATPLGRRAARPRPRGAPPAHRRRARRRRGRRACAAPPDRGAWPRAWRGWPSSSPTAAAAAAVTTTRGEPSSSCGSSRSRSLSRPPPLGRAHGQVLGARSPRHARLHDAALRVQLQPRGHGDHQLRVPPGEPVALCVLLPGGDDGHGCIRRLHARRPRALQGDHHIFENGEEGRDQLDCQLGDDVEKPDLASAREVDEAQSCHAEEHH